MSALGRTKVAYAAAARGTGRALVRAGLLPAAPPPRRHLRRHWAYSLIRVHDAAGLDDLDVPWWTYRAVDAVEAWLASRPVPARVLEWGAGASTVWLARRAGSVHSIEHDAAFAATLRPRLPSHAVVRVVTPVRSEHPAVSSAKEGWTGFDWTDYVAAVDAVDGYFDLVVVDGRARAACLARAVPRLRPDGLIVFDNSRRRRYRDAIETSGLSERRLPGLTPTLPYPEQTSLLTPQGH